MGWNRLIHTGNAVVDLVAPIDAPPTRGGEAFARGARTEAGGGFNSAAAAARQRMEVLYAGGHGAGPLGDLVRKELIHEGVEILHAPIAEVDTGMSVVFVEPDGVRTFLSIAGAETRWMPDQLDNLECERGDWVYATAYSLLHPLSAEVLAAWAPSLPPEARLVVDLCPLIDKADEGALEAVLGRADWICANLMEARRLTGVADEEGATSALAARGRGGAVVHWVDEGCWLADGVAPGVVHVEGFTVEVRDMTGAGDAHTGVFIAASSSGMLPQAAARRANAASALATTRLGPATCPTHSQIDAFLAGMAPGGSGHG